MHLDRLISVLETIAISGRPLPPIELMKATGLPRPTCYRLLQTLTNHRLLDKLEGTLRYQIGNRLKRIVLLGQTDFTFSQIAAPIMKDTANDLGETVLLSRICGGSVEIVHVETPTDPARSYIHPGLGNRPMHACACSKAIAAFSADNFKQKILDGPLVSYTDNTKTTPKKLVEEFERIGNVGYAECVEEFKRGVTSVAAPICINKFGATFSLGVTGPSERLNAAYRKTIGQNLIQTSINLATEFQWRQKLKLE